MDPRWDTVVACASFVVAAASLWLTVFYGEETCALLKGLVH
jgi:hypothetical protein